MGASSTKPPGQGPGGRWVHMSPEAHLAAASALVEMEEEPGLVDLHLRMAQVKATLRLDEAMWALARANGKK